MFPETVGRSLEEVEEIFKSGHVFTAWKIGRNVGRKDVAGVVQEREHSDEEKGTATPEEKA
jgi:hypothetical protein